MVDQIVELEDNRSYVILDKVDLEGRIFYYALRLNEKEEPTNNYLFFEELKENGETFLNKVEDKDEKFILLNAFAINYADMAYDL